MRARTIAGSLLILTIGAIVFANAVEVPFVLDDVGAVTTNRTIRDLGRLDEILAPPQDTTVAGRPVANLTLAIDFALHGSNPAGYHVTNILIHLLSGLLLFGLARRLLRRPSSLALGADGADALAVVITLLWLVHPLQTQAVTYVCQRVESLMGLCCFATLYASVRAAGSTKPLGWALASVLACGVGMGCKEVMAVVPVLVVLMDRAFLYDSWSDVWKERRTLYAGLSVTWIVLALLVATHPRDLSTGLHSAGLRPWDYFRMQCIIVTAYLVLIFHPVNLVFDYGDAITSIPVPARASEWVPGAVVLFSLAVYPLVAWLRGRRDVGFLGAWFFLLLAPSSSFFPIVTEAAAEHRLYLPLLAPLALLAGSVCGALLAWRTPRPLWLLPSAAAALIIGLLGSATIERNGTYASALSLWEDSATNWPSSSRVFLHWGMAAEEEKEHRRAEGLFVRAIALDPSETWAHYHLAQELDRRGAYEAAAAEYGACLRRVPVPGLVEFHIANDLAWGGKVEEALPLYAMAVQADPRHWEFLSRNAEMQLRAGQKEAVVTQAEIVRNVPDFGGARIDYADSLLRAGDLESAMRELSEAIHLDANDSEAWRKLGVLYAMQRNGEAGRRCEQRALLADPEDLLAEEGLAWATACAEPVNMTDVLPARALMLAAARRDIGHPLRVEFIQAALDGLPLAKVPFVSKAMTEALWE